MELRVVDPRLRRKMTVKGDVPTDDRLEEAALLLEAMALKLRQMKRRKGVTKVPADRPSRDETPDGLKSGDRVRVVRKHDQYSGRTGVVLDRRGKLFWYVRLDATEDRCACVIFKKDASLLAVDNN